MPRAVRFARDNSLRVSEARAGGSSDADQGNRSGAPELGLAADPRTAAPRGMVGQSQAHRASVSTGRPEFEAKSTSTQEVGGDSRPGGCDDAPRRAMEHGLHARPAAGRTQAPRADRGRPVHARGAGDRGPRVVLGARRDRRAQPAVEVSSEAGRDPSGQRDGVRFACPGCVGLSRGCEARFQPPREADGQRAHRVVQCPAARGVPERARLRIARRRRGNLDFVAERLQCSASTQRPGHADPQGIR